VTTLTVPAVAAAVVQGVPSRAASNAGPAEPLARLAARAALDRLSAPCWLQLIGVSRLKHDFPASASLTRRSPVRFSKQPLITPFDPGIAAYPTPALTATVATASSSNHRRLS